MSCLLQEVEWYEFVPEIQASGTVTNVAAYDKCNPCGMAAEAFPQKTWEQTCDDCNRSPDDARAFEQVMKALAEPESRTWKPTAVIAESRVGLRIETEYWLIAKNDFFDFYGCFPGELDGAKLVSSVLSETCEHIDGCLILYHADQAKPTKLRARKCILYSDCCNLVVEAVLPLSAQLRPQQHVDTFAWANKQTMAGRPEGLQEAARKRCLTFADGGQDQAS